MCSRSALNDLMDFITQRPLYCIVYTVEYSYKCIKFEFFKIHSSIVGPEGQSAIIRHPAAKAV